MVGCSTVLPCVWQQTDLRVEAAGTCICSTEVVGCFSQQHLLQSMLSPCRKHWRGEESFGSSDEDDMDVLFYIYARYATDRQEGVFIVTVLIEGMNSLL